MEQNHMGPQHIPQIPADSDKYSLSSLRIAIAVLLALLVITYITAIVLGYVPEGRRVDGASLAVTAVLVLAIVIALRPDLADRFKGFEMSGFKVEMLERVRERQAEQAIQLQDMSLMMPLLLPAAERKHLLNVASGNPSNYKGAHSLRTELRRLRSLDLIRMRGDRHVGMMKDGMVFDLQDFIELTDLGRRWSKRITEIERRDPDASTDDELPG
jgi:hypothetical protein